MWNERIQGGRNQNLDFLLKNADHVWKNADLIFEIIRTANIISNL